MILPIEEKKIRLRRGIVSPETPEHVKKEMEAMLEELENPAPEPEPEPEPIPEKKKSTPCTIALPHTAYFKENNIDQKALPLEIRRKIGGLRMLMGKDTDKIRVRAVIVSNSIVDLVKAHLTPPLSPPRVFTVEEKDAKVAEYKRLRERKKQKENS